MSNYRDVYKVDSDGISIRKLLFIMMILIIVGVFFICYFLNYLYQDFKESRNLTEGSYEVKEGDTLYNIADRFCPSWMDKRQYIHKIREKNDITPVIREGQELIILEESGK